LSVPFRGALLVSVLGIVPCGGAWAGGFQAEPAVACEFLAREGLRSRGGYSGSGEVHRCRSRRRNIISGGGINHSIRYVAQGDAERVTRLTLELQVNSRTGMQRAHRHLVEGARALMANALNAPMPEDIKAAILGATKGSWSVAGSTVTLDRIALGGPGYESRFRIR
jgi:hypothetical protein